MLQFSDYRVQELVNFLGEPMNLVSYHLKLLRDESLLIARRGEADGRDVYYHLNHDLLIQFYQEAGKALYLDLPEPQGEITYSPLRIIFLCTGNATRSLIAEALLRTMTHGQMEILSAGSDPQNAHPFAARILQKYSIPTDNLLPRDVQAFVDHEFHYVITVCDKMREVCPKFEKAQHQIHWSVPTPTASLEDFDEVYHNIEARLRFFLKRVHMDGHSH